MDEHIKQPEQHPADEEELDVCNTQRIVGCAAVSYGECLDDVSLIVSDKHKKHSTSGYSEDLSVHAYGADGFTI